MQDENDLVQEFLVESNEGLDQLDADLLSLEQDPSSEELVARIFRTIHSIKGTCGFLGFEKLESVTHVGENLLSKIRAGELGYSQAIADALLRMVDATRTMLAAVATTGQDGDEPFSELIATLEALLEPGTASSGESPAEPSQEPAAEAAPEAAAEAADDPQLDCSEAEAEDVSKVEPQPVEVQETAVPVAEAASPGGDQGAAATQSQGKSGGKGGESIRVQVQQLDKLMNLVGELVLTRNQILLASVKSEDADAYTTTQRLNVITSELQEGVMQIRMQPIGNMWSKLPRVVRDVSRSLGKKVRMEMSGRETELDKTLLEAIKDPFTHIIRNSVDHGIESPADRLAAGKPEEGLITLRAFHESGQVNIEIIDDGKGLDLDRIRAKAVQSGFLTSEAAAALSDRQAADLIFEAGLSTAAEVTNVSGRGVGMDVVRTNIERIGGTIDISTVRGKGTTLKIKIPLTLAIIPALIVTCCDERFAIPQANLVELVRIEGEDLRTSIENVAGVPVYRLRGSLLPLLDLGDRLDMERQPVEEGQEDGVNIVVVHADGRSFGLVVDEVDDTEEIVVKPLHPQLKGTDAFAGSTIMGDGRVALILDVIGLAHSSGVVSRDDEDALRKDSEDESLETTSYLLVRMASEHNVAVPLGAVARLEEIETGRIERVGQKEVVQYRGEIMPLLRLSSALGLPSRIEQEQPDRLPTVVHSVGGRSVGLLVDEVHDIVESSRPVDTTASRGGTLGSVVMDGKVTELLDLEWLLGSQAPELSSAIQGDEAEAGAEGEILSLTDLVDEEQSNRLVCTFKVDGHFFGVDVQHVQEILRWQSVTHIPTTSSVVEGLINLRGQTVLTLDLRQRLGLSPRSTAAEALDEEERPMSVVVRTPEGTVSLLVDEVGDVLEVSDAGHEAPPHGLPKVVEGLITDVFKLEGRLLLCLDVHETARGEFASSCA